MKNLMNYENGIMSTISSIADSMVLGVLWVACSIPIFTMGAASAAFYYAYNKCVRQKTGYIWRTFFAGFRSNFKQATLLWLVVLGLAAILIVDHRLLGLMEKTSPLILVVQTALITLALFVVVWALYLFPYISKFDSDSKTAMKNCALIAVANIPWSILLLLAFAATVLIFICLPMLNLLFPGAYMFCANRILEKVFGKYLPQEEPAA